MPRSVHLSRVSIQRVVGETNYASDDALLESLSTMRVSQGISIDKYIGDLLKGTVDAISFTKDDPYYYFSARRMTSSLSITIKDSTRIIDFSVPLLDAEKILTA